MKCCVVKVEIWFMADVRRYEMIWGNALEVNLHVTGAPDQHIDVNLKKL